MPVFEIPFAYEALVVGKGKRKEVPHVLMSSVVVEVASVSDREAPVALRWHRHRYGDEPHPPHDFRRFGDEGLFKSVFYSYSGRLDRYVTLEGAVENAGNGYRGRANPFFDDENGKTFYDIPVADRRRAEDLEVGSKIVSSDEALVAAGIRSIAANLVAVDGNLFFRKPGNEPIYEAGGGTIWTKSVGGIEPHDLDVRKHFRVDQVLEAIAASGKLPVETTLHGVLPVEVVEADCQAAPLVLRWHQRPKTIGDEAVDQAPTDYRRFGEDGAIYTPVFVYLARQARRAVSLEEMLASVGRGHGGAANPLFAGETFAVDGRNPTAASVEGVVRICSSDEEKVKAQIRSASVELLAVDGMLYRKAEGAEPVYELHPYNDIDRQTGERQRGCYIKTRSLKSLPVEERDVRIHFRVDQIAELMTAAELKGADIGNYDPDDPDSYALKILEYVEIIDPSSLQWRHDQGPYLRKWADSRIEFDKHDIHEQAPATMFAYGELRDALKKQAPASEICDLLAAYAASIVPRMEDDPGDDFWARHAERNRREILDEVEAYEFCPLPEEAPAYLPGPRP